MARSLLQEKVLLISVTWEEPSIKSIPGNYGFFVYKESLMSILLEPVILLLSSGRSKVMSFSSTFSQFHATGSFYSPWKYQKTRGFLMFLAGIESEQWHEMVNPFVASVTILCWKPKIFWCLSGYKMGILAANRLKSCNHFLNTLTRWNNNTIATWITMNYHLSVVVL